MSQRIQILIAEDNPDDAQLLVRELRRAEFDFEWHLVDTEADYLARLELNPDLVLSDYEMPQFSGLRALELLKQRPALKIPFIIVSGTIGEEMAVAAMQQGASDYLLKDRIGRLGPAVRRALQEVEERKERKRLEAQFIEAQKMEVVGQLAGGVAHDFNNVLGVIMGYSDLILQDFSPETPVQQYVEEIRHATKRAVGLTRQLLIFSRKQAVQPGVLDLNKVVEESETMLRRLIEENIEMKIVYGENIGRIKADAGYLWQVLMNMVVNARDAMPDGGRLTIQTSKVTLDEAYVQSHPGAQAGDYSLLRIADTGIGMSDEVKSRMFEAFFTTKPAGKGTGLGLATCQTIVRQSEGYIDVSSQPGQGTTFDIYFPQTDQPDSAMAGPGKPDQPQKKGTETIMVVEDDPSLRHLAQGILHGQGYTVLTAPNGQDALRVVREHHGSALALVITDVVMPRMGGKVMADWLKSSYPDLKVLFTSGYTEDAVALDGVHDETIEFLPKPYTPAALTRKVRELLDAPAHE
jgi:two-component system, cell cycle sensor histidine kinase and response regulator CckA